MAAWKCIVVGVDASPESARAATLGWDLATRAGVPCRLVHVMTEYTTEPIAITLPPTFAKLQHALMEEARVRVEHALQGVVPDRGLGMLEVRPGRPGVELVTLAANCEMLVLGGKHHNAIGRWLAGSTVHQVVRTVNVPLLVAGQATGLPRRILAAVDLSRASEPVLAIAQKFAALFRSELRILHAIDVIPPLSEAAGITPGPSTSVGPDTWYEVERDAFEQGVTQGVRYPAAERVVERGHAEDVIRAQVQSWRPDLLVVGSHGKGWFERLLLGSVTHNLLNHLPTSVLVVPVRIAEPASQPVGLEIGAAFA